MSTIHDRMTILMPGLAGFKDDVDIELDVNTMVPPSEDTKQKDDEFYEQDKAIIDKNLETHEDVIEDDQDGNGDPDILDKQLYRSMYKVHKVKMHLLRELDVIDAALAYNHKHYARLGTEGFTDVIKNLLSGIVNTFGHLLNLFKTALFYGWRDFKRGELSEYADSNALTIRRLYFEDNYYRLANEEIDVPQGMKGTYLQALGSLDAFLAEINMTQRAQRIEEMSANILQSYKRSNPSFSSHIKQGIKDFDTRRLYSLFVTCGKYFTTKRDARSAFNKAFATSKEYKVVCEQCMEGDSYLRAVAGVHSRLESTEKNFTEMIEYGGAASINDLRELSKLARYFAESFDMYSTVIRDRLRIDHNLMLVTKDMRKILGM